MAISKSEPRLPAAPILPIPKRIARYEVIDRLATGGMAEVFICCERGHAGLERLVVVKRILPHLAVHASFVEMFLAEARWVARMNHPNIVQVHELGEDGGAPYLAMEYVPGSSVRDVVVAAIEREIPTPIGAALGIIAQACAGAHAAHELTDPSGQPLGLVHRDISPHNLMVTAEGHTKLLDFGIAKATEAADLDDNTRTGALKGKVHYMAPEQCKQEPLDRRADVFALGVVVWELLAQERLFKRDSELDAMQAIVTGDLKDLRKLRREVPAGVVAAVEKALRPKREDRYATAAEMRTAILDAGRAAGVRCDVDTVAAFVKPLIGQLHTEREAGYRAAAVERTRATPAEGAPSDEATLVDKPHKRDAAVTIQPRTGTAPTVQHLGQPPAAAGRRRRLPWAAVAVVALLALGIGAFVGGQKLMRMRRPQLVMAWAPIAEKDMLLDDVRPLIAYLEDELDRTIDVQVTGSYDELQQRLAAGTVDIGVVPPALFVLAQKEHPELEALAVKLVDGSTGSDGVLYVDDLSGITELLQLKGKRFCYADQKSTTGYAFPRAALRKAGIDPNRDVISHISGNHIAVLRDLAAGVCDAGAVYSGGYLAADRAGVPVQRLRQLAMTGRSPQDAVCAGPKLSQPMRAQLKKALLTFDGRKSGAWSSASLASRPFATPTTTTCARRCGRTGGCERTRRRGTRVGEGRAGG
ncbi:MAG: PhnD/SsuA/transferrin family substrate-binding protein [Deltaproteobacteria bacterium]|nr:PhnD/SsuA/transferrin family substrate-binding protein [Deltaproteobacteria bacterium]